MSDPRHDGDPTIDAVAGTAKDPAADPPAAGPGGATEHAAPSRAGVASSVALIVAVAVVAAAAVMIWAQFSARAAQSSEDPTVPSTLADGSAPAAVDDAVVATIGIPVVGARREDDTAPVADGCGLGDSDVHSVFVTPEHASLLATAAADELPPDIDMEVGPDASGTLDVACVTTWSGERWNRSGATGIAGGESEYQVWMCCDARGRSIIDNLVAVPTGAAWLAEDRGDHVVVYPVEGVDTVGLARAERGDGQTATSHVWWLDDSAAIVGESYVGG